MTDHSQTVKLKNSLKITFIFAFVIFQAFVFLCQGLVVRMIIDRMVYATEEVTLKAMADSLEDTLSLHISDISQLIYANSLNPVLLEGLRDNDYFNVDTLLRKIQRQDSSFDNVFLTDAAGMVKSSTATNLLRTDMSGSDSFQSSVGENRERFISDTAVASRGSGNPVIILSSPIRSQGAILGMLAASVDLSTIGKQVITNKEFGDTGISYVVDKSGRLIIHPEEQRILGDTSGWEFLGEMRASGLETGNSSFVFEETLFQGAFARLQDLDWLLVVAIEDKEVASVAFTVRMAILVSNILLGLLLIVFIVILLRLRIVNRLTPLEHMMRQAAQGVLTDQITVKGRDELASVTTSYNTLVDSLRGFFQGLHQRLEDMESGGSDLAANMEETAAAVQQIKANIGSSMKQVRHQEESVGSTVSAVEEMTRNIASQDQSIERQNSSIIESSSAVEELIAQIQNLSASAEEAERCMKVLVESSAVGQENVRNVGGLVQTISDKSRDLEEANTLISGIAARTNLLAMNAAIEAAHAGDAGKGFAVVADEIRKLAEQSTTQSKQVKNSIQEINQFIRNVVEGAQISGQSFGDIQQNIDRMGRITGEIRSSMAEQASGSGMVLNSLQEMRDIASDVMGGSREMTQGNNVILQAVGSLRDVNHQINMAMQEIAKGIDEINQSVLNVTELTEHNKSSIEGVREDASRYST